MEQMKKIQAPVTEETYNRYMELYNEAAANGGTHATLMEVLLERYSNPVKINADNEAKVKKLTDEVKLLNDKIKDYESDVNTLIEDRQNLEKTVENLRVHLENTETAAAKKVELKTDEYIIHIDPLNKLVLEEVAVREGKRRAQSWSIDDIINYFVEKRFIEGELNGDLNSLSDATVKLLKSKI